VSWLRRRARHDLPPLVPTPAVADLPEAKLLSGARYVGTTTSGPMLDRVAARGLGSRSSCRLSLSGEGLDVVRLAGSFRIPAGSLRGARRDEEALVVTWQHGDLVLDTGFRLTLAELSARSGAGAPAAPDKYGSWVRSISKMAKENAA
jgi:hypothetical protein